MERSSLLRGGSHRVPRAQKKKKKKRGNLPNGDQNKKKKKSPSWQPSKEPSHMNRERRKRKQKNIRERFRSLEKGKDSHSIKKEEAYRTRKKKHRTSSISTVPPIKKEKVRSIPIAGKKVGIRGYLLLNEKRKREGGPAPIPS